MADLKNNIKKPNMGIIMAVYLAGIFMGAIDTGIVTPARTVIQNNLMVDEKLGIWMITIYTLAYAASIPIMGKMADKYGRKYIYLTSIFLFGLGSLFCGLSQTMGSFSFLLFGRVIQALGGGGIVPVATAEFGTTFPPEKRGMALGLVGGVYGVANIFGASAGSAILDLFGKNNWQFIFYVNLPITLFILLAGFLCLSNNRVENTKKTDVLGIFLLTSMVLTLMYGLKNIDFFDFLGTIGTTKVYPFLIIFVVLLPLFILAEKKAQDPVMNLSFFTNPKIVITLILSFVVGIVMMGMIFVPQFSENALKVAAGSGGYFVIILGLFAGAGAPMSGKLIDKFGAKLILALGFIISAIGALFLVFVATNHPSMLTVVVSLVLIGLGMGFTIGTPLNYMMLENTKKEESNSALATLSLIRSVGTVIGPAIMIGFISHAGMNTQPNIRSILPTIVNVPPLPYAQEINDQVNKMKTDPNMKAKMAGIKIPNLTAMTKIKIDMTGNGSYKMPADLLELLQSSDVTTITKNSKIFAERMFKDTSPKAISEIQNGLQEGIDGTINGQKQGLKQLEDVYSSMSGMPSGNMPATGSMPSGKMKNMPPLMSSAPKSLIDMIPQEVKNKIPALALDQLKDVKTLEELQNKISGLKSSISVMESEIAKSKEIVNNKSQALEYIKSAQNKNLDIVSKMLVSKVAVPGIFAQAKENYLKEIDKLSGKIEGEFQTTLNKGFKQVYLTVAISSLLALLILAFYTSRKEEDEEGDQVSPGLSFDND